jgi:hypothetical protein
MNISTIVVAPQEPAADSISDLLTIASPRHR